jgi:hypothetical protein
MALGDPKQVPDFIALRGDPSDKWLARSGWAKLAAKLVCRYGTLFLDITKRNRYERSSNGERMLHSAKVNRAVERNYWRSWAKVLPNLYSFNSESDLDFASTISLLHKYLNDLKASVEKVIQNVGANFLVS